MSGIAFKINVNGINDAIAKLDGIASIDIDGLLEQVGGLAESQTRERLDESKTDPDGKAWDDWSDRYKSTRHGGHSLLDNEGNLADSITFITGSDYVSVGSPLIYSAAHQFGYEDNNLSARAYLGLSEDNEAEIIQVMNDYVEGVLNA